MGTTFSMGTRKAPVAATVGAILTGALLAAGLAGPTGSATAAKAEFDHIELALDGSASPAVDDALRDQGATGEGEVAPRIFGGRPAADGEFPFTVYLGVLSNVGDFACTGSVISPEWVLTAAHCIADDSGNFLPVLDAFVVAGSADLADATQANIFGATDLFKPIDYSPPATGFAHDFALVRLDQPVTVRGLPLPPTASPLEAPGVTGTFTGWGLLNENPDISTTRMHVGAAPILGDASCGLYFPGVYVAGLMNCTGPPPGTAPVDASTCQGDSGGPMFVPFGSDYLQAGITSFGPVPCQLSRIGAYTKVSTYAQSIANLLQSEQPGLGPPVATTGGVIQQHDDGLTVQGTVDPNGIATAYQVEWGTTPALGSGVVRGYAGDADSAEGRAYGGMGSNPVGVSARISGAPAGTEIFYRVSALSAAGTSLGQTASGQTSSPPPPPAPPPPAPPPAPTAGDPVCNDVPPRRTSQKGTVRFTRQGLKIEQNIASAALRRLNAANAWIDAGIVPTDLCARAFGPDAFQGGIPWAGGAPARSAAPPTPRQLEIVKKKKPPARFTAGLRQVRINDNISRALLARAQATWARINDLTGGNLAARANLSGRPLYAGLSLAGVPPPSSRSAPTPLEIGPLPPAGRVRATAAQVRKTQRRTQEAIRLANRVNDRIRAGLTEEQFRARTIGSARLS